MNSLDTAKLAFCLAAAFAATLHAADSTDIQVLSATVRDQKIAGASVILQKNGEQSYATTTDSVGRAHLRETPCDHWMACGSS